MDTIGAGLTHCAGGHQPLLSSWKNLRRRRSSLLWRDEFRVEKRVGGDKSALSLSQGFCCRLVLPEAKAVAVHRCSHPSFHPIRTNNPSWRHRGTEGGAAQALAGSPELREALGQAVLGCRNSPSPQQCQGTDWTRPALGIAALGPCLGTSTELWNSGAGNSAPGFVYSLQC